MHYVFMNFDKKYHIASKIANKNNHFYNMVEFCDIMNSVFDLMGWQKVLQQTHQL